MSTFTDDGLTRTFANVGECQVEFEFDPGDPSVGIFPGFASVCFSFRLPPLCEMHITFEYQEGTYAAESLTKGDNNDVSLGVWTLACITVKVRGDEEVRYDIEPRPHPLSDFSDLLTMAQDKWAAIEEQERQAEDELARHLAEEPDES